MERFLTVFIIIMVIVLVTFLFFDFRNITEDNSKGDPTEHSVVENNFSEAIQEELVVEESNEEEEIELEEPVKETRPSAQFIQCLVDSGMVVYASKTCPACTSLANQFGGYDSVENLFVICSEQGERCNAEMQTGYVPEIQINGELLDGSRTLENFAAKTACVL